MHGAGMRKTATHGCCVGLGCFAGLATYCNAGAADGTTEHGKDLMKRRLALG